MSKEALSPKLLRRVFADDEVHLCHWCPGCEAQHMVRVHHPAALSSSWVWDGSVNAPTLSPSVHHSWGEGKSCHYFIRAGQIEFCGDCHHALAGQTVPLPDLPAWVLA